MTFAAPQWFWGLLLLPLLILLYARHEARRRKLIEQLVAARLFDRLVGNVSLGRRRLRFGFLLYGLAFLVSSLARPRYGYTLEESKREGLDVIIAIDCSRSMLAQDVSPSRLMRAKLASQDLIAQLQGDRVGIIAFAGTSFLQAPLTVDYSAVLDSLMELDTDVIPRGGTNIASAITEADAAFGKGEGENRCLILFTDGEELEADAVAAAEAEKDHMRIFTVGVGSADGSLIPIPGENGGTDFVKDENGQIVKSRLDEPRLRKIAETTGGFYVHLQNGPAEMQQIVRDGLGQMKQKEFETRTFRRPIERYQWPLSAALLLLTASTLFGERRRRVSRGPTSPSSSALTPPSPSIPPPLSVTPPPLPVAARVSLLIALLFLPLTARAAKNSGVEAYDRQDYSGAATEFDRQLRLQKDSAALNFDLGTAAYKSGDYDKALDAFSKAVTSPDPALRGAAEYNLGNTLFQQGASTDKKEARDQHWKDAIQHYDEALKVTPQNKDAAYNREVVGQLMKEQKPPEQQQQQQQNQQQNKKDKNKDDQQNQQNQQSQQNQQQNSQQQNQQNQQSQSQQQQQQSQNQQSQGQQSQSQQSQGSSGQQQQPQNQQGNSQQRGQSQDQQDKNHEGQSQQDKDKQGQSQQDKNQEGKNGEQKQQQNQGGQGDQKYDNKSDPSQQNQPQQDGQGDQNQRPKGELGKKHEGDIKPLNGEQQQPQGDPQKEAQAEAQAAQEGRMTEAQARNLVESLRDEDAKVSINQQSDKKSGPRKFRNW